jgi:outer membrane lipoprotein-sorting protein
LKESQKKFKSLTDLKADFVFTLSNPNLKKPIVKNGVAQISGNKYKIVFPDEEMYCDAKRVWLVSGEDEEVTVSCFDPTESISPDKIFSLTESGAKTRYDGQEEGMDKITLFSKEESDLIRTEVWINPKDKLVARAKMIARNGSTYEYKMTKITPNTGIAASTFTFNHAAKESQGWIVTNLCD